MFLYCQCCCLTYNCLAAGDLSGVGMEKKHKGNFSLDVQPYMLTIRKPKADVAHAEPTPPDSSLDTVFLEGTHTIVHVPSSITGSSNCCSGWCKCLPQIFLSFDGVDESLAGSLESGDSPRPFVLLYRQKYILMLLLKVNIHLKSVDK